MLKHVLPPLLLNSKVVASFMAGATKVCRKLQLAFLAVAPSLPVTFVLFVASVTACFAESVGDVLRLFVPATAA